mmetsp:Transcript_25480/g.85255  ORF Transcript_25480/g.85255 Transcript_25480/m.85255 type:complete len:213 (+) Transcript_25480:180-818(+)
MLPRHLHGVDSSPSPRVGQAWADLVLQRLVRHRVASAVVPSQAACCPHILRPQPASRLRHRCPHTGAMLHPRAPLAPVQSSITRQPPAATLRHRGLSEAFWPCLRCPFAAATTHRRVPLAASQWLQPEASRRSARKCCMLRTCWQNSPQSTRSKPRAMRGRRTSSASGCGGYEKRSTSPCSFGPARSRPRGGEAASSGAASTADRRSLRSAT